MPARKEKNVIWDEPESGLSVSVVGDQVWIEFDGVAYKGPAQCIVLFPEEVVPVSEALQDAKLRVDEERLREKEERKLERFLNGEALPGGY